MTLRYCIEYLREEHEELLRLADKIEKMLELASNNDFTEHLKSINELRSLAHGLTGIVEHCRAGDRIIESAYYHTLPLAARTRLDAEHEEIILAVKGFKEELQFATADRTLAMVVPGMDVVDRLRAHIAYEREVLGKSVKVETSPKKTGEKADSEKRAHENKYAAIA